MKHFPALRSLMLWMHRHDAHVFIIILTVALALVAMLMVAVPMNETRGRDGCVVVDHKPAWSWTFTETGRSCEETP